MNQTVKVVDETEGYENFEEVEKELLCPSVKKFNQFVVIQELSSL